MKPGFIRPMLATLADEPFGREGWLYEAKLDGIRCLAVRNGDQAEMWTRNQLPLHDRFPGIAAALLKQKRKVFAVDGEVVAFRGDVTSFEALQQRSGPFFFYLFDVLNLDGADTRGLPQRERKTLLETSFQFKDPIRYSEHREGDGVAYLDDACRRGMEGIIAKDASAPYVSARSKAWLKFKCLESQELVIGGWTDPAGARQELGALLVGYHDKGMLKFAGKVGTGFDRSSLRELGAKLRTLETPASPFEPGGGLPKLRVHWVKPELVAQIAFHEWTAAGKLRQPRFQGLRTDKAAADIVRERTARG